MVGDNIREVLRGQIMWGLENIAKALALTLSHEGATGRFWIEE